MKKVTLAAILLLILLSGGVLYLQSELRTSYFGSPSPVVVEIPHGLRARDVVGLLRSRNVIRNEYTTLAYIWYSGQRHRLQAGEYRFDKPQSPIEVIHKIATGMVYLHRFTVPEGLTIDKTADQWEAQGFGSSVEFRKAAAESLALVRKFDAKATSVEGFLFPETYSFPARTNARQAVESMIGSFRTVAERLEKEVPREKWPLDFRDTVVLASLVEAEAAREDERPLVASVYLNRLNRRILLQCDPTVIYALEQADKYKGSLTLDDLKFQSPYNTYVTPGLPPGPIMNPGYRSLRAAVEPAASPYLFFVRTTDGRHTFSENYSEHSRAVAAYRELQRQSK